MERKYLRRYTTLPFLLDVLHKKKITLLNPNTWEDRNDPYFIELYKRKKNKKTVLALCFSESNETYHHWKIYSNGSAGVCIQFKKKDLINCIKPFGTIIHNRVLYKTVDQLDKDIFEGKLDINKLPFVKRYAFRDELEYRFLYEDELKEINSIDVEINLGSISKIILNPWLPHSVRNSTTDIIHSIDGCKEIKVIQTTLVDNMEWKSYGETILAPVKTQHSSWKKEQTITDSEDY